MIDYLVRLISKWDKLYNAIANEVEIETMVGRTMNDPEAMETAASFWDEGDGWRGWAKNSDMNRYFFNDIPEYGFVDADVQLDVMQGVITLE